MLIKGASRRPGSPGAILLIQLGDIGDVVLTMPAIEAFRERFPDCNLFVCVREKARDLIDDSPLADGTFWVPSRYASFREAARRQRLFFRQLRQCRFDWAIDFRTGTRGAIIAFLSGASYRLGRSAGDGWLWRDRLFTHLVRPDPEKEIGQYVPEHAFNILAPLGLTIGGRLPRLHVPPERARQADTLLRENGIPPDRPIVAFHPFSLWRYKEWGPEPSAALIDYVWEAFRLPVIITGAPEERPRAEAVTARSRGTVFNLAGRTSIGILAAVLKKTRLFIGVDTAALHMAAAVGTPTIGIFGPSNPVSWAPRGAIHRVVSKDLSCRPCRRRGCEDLEASRCLDELTFEEIRPAVDRQIAEVLGKTRLNGGPS